MAATRGELVEILILYAETDYTPDQDPLVESIVDDAIEEVRNRRYPFGYFTAEELAEQQAEVMLRYDRVIRNIMKYHYDKIGKEGVKTFYEAGQTTTYDTPETFLSNVIPLATLV